MRVAISNIAWPLDQDALVADKLSELRISAIEVAPTKIWPAPLEATDAQIESYRHFWNSRGISIIAAQALLFGQPGLTLFEGTDARHHTLEYLKGIIRVCTRLGAESLVFGSPKNRRAGNQELSIVWQQAIEFFGRLGEIAKAEGASIVMEANPPEYGCDFVTRADEAFALVQAVNHPGFQLHLDAACMSMVSDSPEEIIPKVGSTLAHFHASEPGLAPVGHGTIDHSRFASVLAASGYSGWISIEMRQIDPFDVCAIQDAIEAVKASYQTPYGN